MREYDESEQERAKAQLDIIKGIIQQEDSLFLNVASLAVAMVVVLSLGKDLISFSPLEAKIILSLFLVLIVLTIATGRYMFNTGKKKGFKIIEEILGFKIDVSSELSFFQKAVSRVPNVVMATFCFCILYVLFVLWR